MAEDERTRGGEWVSMVCGCLLGVSGLLRSEGWDDPFRWLGLALLVGCGLRLAVLALRR